MSTLSELLEARAQLAADQRTEIALVKEKYRLKFEAINSQIARESKKGVKKRIKSVKGFRK